MALPILDGNQSATTLSTILSSGQHITAHTVVSLGTQAITDMQSAISGSVVSISNLPATQPVSISSVTIGNTVTIAGTVTANPTGTQTIAGSVTLGAGTAQIGSVTASVTNPVTVGAIVGPIGGSVFKGSPTTDAIRALPYFSQNGSANYNELSTSNPFPIAGTVTVGNSVTISSLPAISGTVTANLGSSVTLSAVENNDIGAFWGEGGAGNPVYAVNTGWLDSDNFITGTSTQNPFPVQVVSAGAFRYFPSNTTTAVRVILGREDGAEWKENTDNVPIPVNIVQTGAYAATSVTISGTVTIGSALPAGTNRIGVVTIGAGTVTLGASTAQIGSVTASISNSVTIASLPAISGTVTANLSISATAITSGSFSSLTSATLVPGNTARKMATVYNLGAGQLFINAGATATTLGGGFMVALSSGDFYECPYTTTTLSAIFATAGTASWVSH